LTSLLQRNSIVNAASLSFSSVISTGDTTSAMARCKQPNPVIKKSYISIFKETI